MPVYLTPTLMDQKYPFLSLSPFHGHLVLLVPCGPFTEQQKEDYIVFLRQLRALEREMKALQMVNGIQTTLECFFGSKNRPN